MSVQSRGELGGGGDGGGGDGGGGEGGGGNGGGLGGGLGGGGEGFGAKGGAYSMTLPQSAPLNFVKVNEPHEPVPWGNDGSEVSAAATAAAAVGWL